MTVVYLKSKNKKILLQHDTRINVSRHTRNHNILYTLVDYLLLVKKESCLNMLNYRIFTVIYTIQTSHMYLQTYFKTYHYYCNSKQYLTTENIKIWLHMNKSILTTKRMNIIIMTCVKLNIWWDWLNSNSCLAAGNLLIGQQQVVSNKQLTCLIHIPPSSRHSSANIRYKSGSYISSKLMVLIFRDIFSWLSKSCAQSTSWWVKYCMI